MAYNLSDFIVIGISSSALFDLSYEDSIYQKQGVKKYIDYQIKHEKDILKPGVGFKLIKTLLRLNDLLPKRRVEVIIMSKNSADSIIRIFNSIEHYNLDICRAIMTSGDKLEPYLKALNIDLFLSTNEEDVLSALVSGIAAGIVCNDHQTYEEDLEQIRIAFDGDAVLFSNEAELIYQENGLEAFSKHEKEQALIPLKEGPFMKFLKTLKDLQQEFYQAKMPLRTALVTSRSAPSHERAIRTLRSWDVTIDEVFFLGGVKKAEILHAFGAHIYFDDQDSHLKESAKYVPSVKVPYI